MAELWEMGDQYLSLCLVPWSPSFNLHVGRTAGISAEVLLDRPQETLCILLARNFSCSKAWKLCKSHKKIREVCFQSRLWMSEVLNGSRKHADIDLLAGTFMNILLRFLTPSLALLLTAAWERIQKRNGQSLKTEKKILMHTRKIK